MSDPGDGARDRVVRTPPMISSGPRSPPRQADRAGPVLVSGYLGEPSEVAAALYRAGRAAVQAQR
ncbi:hypothetical protein GCM10027614_06860 [Micromonospora vulcania]